MLEKHASEPLRGGDGGLGRVRRARSRFFAMPPDSQSVVVPGPELAGNPPAAPGPAELFCAFAKMPLAGFGGALVWARRSIVERRRWMTTEEFNRDLRAVPLPAGLLRRSSGARWPAIIQTALVALSIGSVGRARSFWPGLRTGVGLQRCLLFVAAVLAFATKLNPFRILAAGGFWVLLALSDESR